MLNDRKVLYKKSFSAVFKYEWLFTIFSHPRRANGWDEWKDKANKTVDHIYGSDFWEEAEEACNSVSKSIKNAVSIE